MNNKFGSINLPKNSLYDKYLNDGLLKVTGHLESIMINEDFSDKISFLEKLHEINSLIESNKNDYGRIEKVMKSILSKEFNSEFKKFDNTSIKFYGNFENSEFSHNIIIDGISRVNVHNKGEINCLPFENILYIDSTSIFEIPDQ